jgi:hypothetical protein
LLITPESVFFFKFKIKGTIESVYKKNQKYITLNSSKAQRTCSFHERTMGFWLVLSLFLYFSENGGLNISEQVPL